MRRAKVGVEDGLAYLERVKTRFEAHRPHVYNSFLGIMSDFQQKRCDTAGVVGRMISLFGDERELILRFNAFLPAGHSIEEADGAYQLAFPSGIRRPIPPCADGPSASLRPRRQLEGSSSLSDRSLPGRVRRRTPLGGADTQDSSPGVLLTWYSSNPFVGATPSVLGARRHRRRPPAAAAASASDDDAQATGGRARDGREPVHRKLRPRTSDDGDADSPDADSAPDSRGSKRARIACRRSSPRNAAAAVH